MCGGTLQTKQRKCFGQVPSSAFVLIVTILSAPAKIIPRAARRLPLPKMTRPQFSTACPDWAERLKMGVGIIPAPIYPKQAQHALEIFKRLRIGDLPGKPTFGEIARPWVFDFVAAVFGGYDSETGEQLIKEYAVLIAKKNTKSTIAAGIMLTALLTSWRENEEHLILAPTKEVADNAFSAAEAMVRADSSLAPFLRVKSHIKCIVHRVTNNSLKVVSASVNAVSGKKAGRVLVDELWAFGKYDKSDGMIMEATGGQIARPEGWTIYLSTQSEETPAGVFKSKLEYWRKVRDGVVEDNTVLPIIYEYPPDMIEDGSFKNPDNFYIANPNLGASVSGDFLLNQLRKVEDKRDGSFQKFIAKHFNVEITTGLTNNRWAAAEFWAAAADKQMTLGDLIERSEVICCGIDGGGLDDLLGFAVIGREKGTGKWLHWAHAWAHEICLTRNTSQRMKLKELEAAGELTVVAKPGEDVRGICDYMQKLLPMLPKKAAIGVDAAGISAIVDALTENDLVQMEQICTVRQGWGLNPAIKTVERMIAARDMIHCGGALMDYCVQNALVSDNGNAVQITKQTSRGKIDALMATFDAVTMMALNPARASRKRELVFATLR